MANNCSRKVTCFKCADNHMSDEYNNNKKKCTNCMFKNETFNLNLNDNHDALSTKCPTYMKAVSEVKKRIEGEAR